jgi:hypothetical protein
MKTYNNINELILDLPKYIIPIEYIDIYWYLKLKNNANFKIIIPKVIIKKLESKFGNVNNTNYEYLNKKIDNFKECIVGDNKFKFLRSGKIIYYDIIIPNDMIICNDCGNIWDGNAQCDCYLYNDYFNELYF